MAASQFVAQPLYQQALSATGFSPVFSLNQNFNNVLAEIEIAAAPTGTTPAITFQLYLSLDGATYEPFGSATSSLNAVGITALNNNNAIAPFAKVGYTVTGTTPNFPNVTINVYMN